MMALFAQLPHEVLNFCPKIMILKIQLWTGTPNLMKFLYCDGIKIGVYGLELPLEAC